MFSLICAWISSWVNNPEAGDLRRHRANYDVTVMILNRSTSDPDTFGQREPVVNAHGPTNNDVIAFCIHKLIWNIIFTKSVFRFSMHLTFDNTVAIPTLKRLIVSLKSVSVHVSFTMPTQLYFVASFRSDRFSDATWCLISKSILNQVLACCLMAPNHCPVLVHCRQWHLQEHFSVNFGDSYNAPNE